MPVVIGDEMNAMLDAATGAAADMKIEVTEKYCFEAMRLVRATGKDPQPIINQALEILRRLYESAAKSDSAKAEQWRKRKIDVASEYEQPNGYQTGSAHYELCSYRYSVKQFADAEAACRRAIPLLEGCAADSPPCSRTFGDVLAFEGAALHAQDKFSESLEYLQRASARPDDGIHSVAKLAAMRLCANALLHLGRPGDAMSMNARAEEYAKSHPEAAQ
jgi:tetratricopeptide (TPR) repeat protein